ncbi:MAG: Wzz/FepE/Etk N-terminal domain-containing protein [Pseudomonadota bacterium]
MGPIYSLSDFLDMVRRRMWLILAVTVIGCAFSVMVALSRPHEYQSSQVIQIAQPVIVDELARTTVGGSSARRLQLIEQRLMARDSVLEVIDRYDLYSDLTGIPLSRKVNLLRSSILIEGVAAAREGFSDDGTISVITISARMGTPELAQKLAREFGDRTIELSSRERIEQAQKTLEFFDGQSEALASEISALEEQIADYQRTNDLSLPGSLEFRRDEIAAINNTLLDIARDPHHNRHICNWKSQCSCQSPHSHGTA